MEKKVLLMLAACAMLGLASCGGNAVSSATKSSTAGSSSSSAATTSSSVAQSSSTQSSSAQSSSVQSSSSVDSTVYATGLSVDAEAVTLKVEATHQITATVAPTNVTTAGVTYASSATDIATVSDAGLITAVKAGTANITVTTKSLDGKGGKALTKTVVVTVTLKSISDVDGVGAWDVKGVVSGLTTKGFMLSDATGSIYVYQNAAPTYVIGDVLEVSQTLSSSQLRNGVYQFDTGATVTAVTDTAPTIAEATALTTAIADGWKTKTAFTRADVVKYKWTTYAAASGKYTTINLDGSATVIENTYTPTTLAVTAGNKYEVEGYFLGYSSSNSYAAIALTKVTQVWDAPTAISITASAETVVAGETITLSAAVTPTTAKQDVIWSVANKDTTITTPLASIADTGVLTGIAAGTVVVTVTPKAITSVTATKEIVVEAAKPDPVGLTATIADSLIAIGKTSAITITLDPANAKPAVTYASSDTAVATVDENGIVTGVAAGKANITVTSTPVPTLTQTIAVEVAEAKAVPAANIGVTMSTTTETTLTGVYALTSFENSKTTGFIGATENGIVYVYDSSDICAGATAGKYYDLIGKASLYKGTYEFMPGTTDTTKKAFAENTTCTHYAWSFTPSLTLDFSDIASVTSTLQGLVGKTDEEVGNMMAAIQIKNVYIPALNSGYSFMQAVAGTDFSCLTAAENTRTIKLGLYNKYMSQGWTSATQLVNYEGFFYATSNAFSAGASAANITCRLAGGKITSVK
jgi:uncharacterized protein YjdB